MSDAPVAAQRRSANFFRGTMRDAAHEPDTAGSTEHLETVALAAIKTNLEAHAQSLGRTLPGADLSNMLKAAQSYLRRLPREQLAGFSSSSSLMSAITKDSFAAAPIMDAKGAALTAAQSQSGGEEQSNIIAGRFRESFERTTLNSSQRYAAMGGENFSQADTGKIAAAMGAARDYGMTWMTPRDLLSIGPAGVKAIADVNLKQDSYQRLRTDLAAAPAALSALASVRAATTDAASNVRARLHSATGPADQKPDPAPPVPVPPEQRQP
jgi:hypothetical protein